MNSSHIRYLVDRYNEYWHEIISVLTTHHERRRPTEYSTVSLLDNERRLSVSRLIEDDALGRKIWLSDISYWSIAVATLIEKMREINLELSLDVYKESVSNLEVPFSAMDRLLLLLQGINTFAYTCMTPNSSVPDELEELCSLMNKLC